MVNNILFLLKMEKSKKKKKKYYWQEKGVYNHIQPLIERWCKNLSEEDLYGEKGLVGRLVPVQRAYNAIKNREMEYLNRIAMGALAVEDGSVDLDNLEREGISPGKVIVYRQGANAPKMLTKGLDVNTQVFADAARSYRVMLTNMVTMFVDSHGRESK